MSDLRTAAQQALEALKMMLDEYGETNCHASDNADAAIYTLCAALAEPVQEPVAWIDAPEQIWLQVCEDDHCEVPFHEHAEITWCAERQNPLDVPYVRADLAAPPQRKPLTDEEIRQAADQRGIVIVGEAMIAFARAIERAHGIGDNT